MHVFLLCLALALASIAVGAQDGFSTPPIPRPERFVARTALKATLRVSPSVVVADQELNMSLLLENTGTSPVRVPGAAGVHVTKLVFTATGREVLVGPCGTFNSQAVLTPVRTLRVLAPGRKLEEDFRAPRCSSGAPALLPMGSYEIHATFRNFAGSPYHYDVYERRAEEVWEGTLTIPPVSVTLLPFPFRIALGGSDVNAEPRRSSADGIAMPVPLTAVPPRLNEGDAGETSPFEDIRPRPEAEHLDIYLNAIVEGRSEAQGLALSGIARFGRKEMYAPLRGLMSNSEERRYEIGKALAALTFTQDIEGFISPTHWDAWWRRHGEEPRERWAREALNRTETRAQAVLGNANSPAARAADYLVTSLRGDERVVRELAQHRSWRVRLATADALASFDQRYAGELLVRELSNRYLAACQAASEQLSQLTRTAYALDCHDTAARAAGISHWRAEVARLPRTALPDAPLPR